MLPQIRLRRELIAFPFFLCLYDLLTASLYSCHFSSFANFKEGEKIFFLRVLCSATGGPLYRGFKTVTATPPL